MFARKKARNTRWFLPALTGLILLSGPNSAALSAADAPFAGLPSGGSLTAAAPTQQNMLTYHFGPVMQTNTTYAIFWAPPIGFAPINRGTPTPYACIESCPPPSPWANGYIDAVTNFLIDVAADSGKATNVYSITAEYTLRPYQSAFGGSYIDANDYPPPDPAGNPDCPTKLAAVPVCLTDGQIQTEIQRVRALNHWPAGLGNLYLVFTPQGVGSCVKIGPKKTELHCAYFNLGTGHGGYCAYHFSIGTSVIYANQPFPVLGCLPAYRDPRAEVLDSLSHEHIEAITDPLGTAWYADKAKVKAEFVAHGAEIADVCKGTVSPTTINGHPYRLQAEWSNAAGACRWEAAP